VNREEKRMSSTCAKTALEPKNILTIKHQTTYDYDTLIVLHSSKWHILAGSHFMAHGFIETFTITVTQLPIAHHQAFIVFTVHYSPKNKISVKRRVQLEIKAFECHPSPAGPQSAQPPTQDTDEFVSLQSASPNLSFSRH